MTRRKLSGTTWAACKGTLKKWPRQGILALVHELYQLNADNRVFLHARLLPDQSVNTVEQVKRKLGSLLSRETVWRDQFRHIDLKRAIDHFERACGDEVMVADVLLFDLETAFETFEQVGDYEPIVDHLYATIKRLDRVLTTVSRDALPPLTERLTALSQKWGASFGYGISDELVSFAAEWSEKTGPPTIEHDETWKA